MNPTHAHAQTRAHTHTRTHTHTLSPHNQRTRTERHTPRAMQNANFSRVTKLNTPGLLGQDCALGRAPAQARKCYVRCLLRAWSVGASASARVHTIRVRCLGEKYTPPKVRYCVFSFAKSRCYWVDRGPTVGRPRVDLGGRCAQAKSFELLSVVR